MVTESQKELLKLTDKDFYSMHTRVLRLVNKVALELGLEPTKRCLDCLRRKWFEILRMLNNSGVCG